MTSKDWKNVKIYSPNPLHLIFTKVDRYFEGINGNKYLTLVLTNESKEKNFKKEELWSNIRDLISQKVNNQEIGLL